MSDLLADLGLEFVDPYSINAGLKQLKPQDEPQIFSVITQIPGLPNAVVKYPQHYFEPIKKAVRCTGGACCIKAEELKDAAAKLPPEEQKKVNTGKRQVRYLFPVVLYQGKSANAYGGPVEVRYMNISGFTYTEWDAARESVNADIAPFYERDFILTKKSPQMPSAQMHHLETKAKWLTDPAIHAEVMRQLSDPEFIKEYVKVIPPKMSEDEFLSAWNAAKSKATVAEQMLSQNVGLIPQPITPAIPATPTVAPQAVGLVTPEITPQVVATPQVAVSEATPAPLNIGLPLTPVSTNPSVDVPFTPQNIINGTYNTGAISGVVTPESITNMQPVTVTEASAPAAPTTSQSEISLAGIGDLDAIINSLPPQ